MTHGWFIGESTIEWLHSAVSKVAYVGGYDLNQVPRAGTPRLDVLTPPIDGASARNYPISSALVSPRICEFFEVLGIHLCLQLRWLCQILCFRTHSVGMLALCVPRTVSTAS